MTLVRQDEIYPVFNPVTRKIDMVSIYTGEVINGASKDVSQFVYTIEMGEVICDMIREGYSLHKISKREGMPKLHTLYNWRAHNPEFKKKLDQAKKDRAEYHMDRASDLAEEAEGLSKDEVPAMKLAIDSFIKLAEKGNPEQFQAKPQLQHGSAPAMIVINTGIDRNATVEFVDENNKSNQKVFIGRGEDGSTEVSTCEEESEIEESDYKEVGREYEEKETLQGNGQE